AEIAWRVSAIIPWLHDRQPGSSAPWGVRERAVLVPVDSFQAVTNLMATAAVDMSAEDLLAYARRNVRVRELIAQEQNNDHEAVKSLAEARAYLAALEA
ncbi:hypothetical protein, partial [Streptosporangium jomthongense]